MFAQHILSEQVALVTGGSRGIGSAIAMKLGGMGAKVGVNYNSSRAEAEAVARMIIEAGGDAITVQGDVSSDSEASDVVAKINDHWGQVDILINNAGITRDKLLMRMSLEDWDNVIDVDLKSAFLCTKYVMPQLIKRSNGRIINISSVVGLKGNAGQANYAASKAGIIGLTKSSSKELASRVITVNCIAPGYIATDMTDQLTDKVKEEIINRIPLGYIGKTDNIAAAALFLASDEAEYITGQTISVDGGMVIN